MFGFDSFQVGHSETARKVLAGKDDFVRMKPSGGKSLCYLLPAPIFPGTLIVISPLISLTEDQVGRNRNTLVLSQFFISWTIIDGKVASLVAKGIRVTRVTRLKDEQLVSDTLAKKDKLSKIVYSGAFTILLQHVSV